jgi:hypothetical protein
MDLVTGFIACLIALVLIFGLRIYLLVTTPKEAPHKKDDDHDRLRKAAPPAPVVMGEQQTAKSPAAPASPTSPSSAVSPTSAKPVRRARRED